MSKYTRPPKSSTGSAAASGETARAAVSVGEPAPSPAQRGASRASVLASAALTRGTAGEAAGAPLKRNRKPGVSLEDPMSRAASASHENVAATSRRTYLSCGCPFRGRLQFVGSTAFRRLTRAAPFGIAFRCQ